MLKLAPSVISFGSRALVVRINFDCFFLLMLRGVELFV